MIIYKYMEVNLLNANFKHISNVEKFVNMNASAYSSDLSYTGLSSKFRINCET